MQESEKKNVEELEEQEEIIEEDTEDFGENEDTTASAEKKEAEEANPQKTEEKLEDTDNNDIKIEELTNQLLRLQADFSNYKKRVEKDREGYIDLGVKKLAQDLLPVMDNLERALKSIEEYAKEDEIFKGINLIDDQLLEVLNKNNINEIKALGEKFDPNFHHAVAMVEADENTEADVVVDVLQKGYQIKDTIIRPSMVRVSK